ncbi:MAG: aminotransferase class I/II-fold pyridoxal phosphate-dependent enzyme [Myxococcales bacterium]|jgi:cystathionine gamma-synthase|nr:aminotransferase class I/II-fold pyridoxal phosphate-dependent enzyme [Myxococcales bacterium]
MSDSKNRFAGSTDAVHAGTPRHRPHHALALEVAQTATYTFESTADLEQYMRGEDDNPNREEYGRYGNPTVRELENRVAALEACDDAIAFSSGMAAMTTTLFALLKQGDHVVLFRDCYRRTRQFVTTWLSRFGVEHSVVPPGDLDALEAALRPNTRLVVTEAPTNPFLYCVDLAELVKRVKARGRIRTVVDSTFATPINCRPHEFGIDVVVHSATKYFSGHNDVLGGVVAGPSHLVSLLREARDVMGATLDPHAAFLIARGLKTLALRVRQQNHTTQALAEALAKHPRVEQVFYPGLPSHPSHEIARRQMNGYGGVISFIVRGGKAAASRVVDASRIARIAPSLGGVESLIEQPSIMSYFELDEEQLGRIGIQPSLIRLAVGIEDTEDVLADVLHALEQA